MKIDILVHEVVHCGGALFPGQQIHWRSRFAANGCRCAADLQMAVLARVGGGGI